MPSQVESVTELSLGRRSENLLPVAQQTNALTKGVVVVWRHCHFAVPLRFLRIFVEFHSFLSSQALFSSDGISTKWILLLLQQ